MQIHELTKRRKQRTDEAGLLSGLKSAIDAAKTGFNAGRASDARSPGVAGAAGALGALTSPSAYAAAAEKNAAASAMAKYNKVMGIDPNAPAQPATATTQAAPQQQQQQVQAMVQQFTQEPEFNDLTAVLPDPGQVLRVELPNPGGSPAEYFKDESGTWKTKDNKPVTKSASVRRLESMIDADQYTQVAPPPTAAPQTQQGQPQQGKNKKASQTESIAEAVGNRKVQSIVAKIINKNRAAAAAAEKAKASPQGATKVDQAYNKVLAAAAMPKSKAPNRRAKANIIKQAFTNYATQIVQAGGAAPQGDQTQPGDEQTQGQQTSPAQKQMAAQTITTKAGIDGAKLAKAVAVDPQVKQATEIITKESRKPLTQRLEEAIQMLKEDQVYITKDIHVRTAGGDYVKRASDQYWYDPKGVKIDPVKYAEYVAKLDKTPQAQTQYQADALKADKGKGPGGTDAGAQQAAQTPPPPPPPPPASTAAPQAQPDPMDQALQRQKMQQWLRGQNVDSLNAQIRDTTNQLRNAQIFGTGQADYLQQQLAQLIAMKV